MSINHESNKPKINNLRRTAIAGFLSFASIVTPLAMSKADGATTKHASKQESITSLATDVVKLFDIKDPGIFNNPEYTKKEPVQQPVTFNLPNGQEALVTLYPFNKDASSVKAVDILVYDPADVTGNGIYPIVDFMFSNVPAERYLSVNKQTTDAEVANTVTNVQVSENMGKSAVWSYNLTENSSNTTSNITDSKKSQSKVYADKTLGNFLLQAESVLNDISQDKSVR
jgi:hypothetical protein